MDAKTPTLESLFLEDVRQSNVPALLRDYVWGFYRLGAVAAVELIDVADDGEAALDRVVASAENPKAPE